MKNNMKIQMKQHLKLSQKIKISLEVLQMSTTEINNYINDLIYKGIPLEIKYNSKIKYIDEENNGEIENISLEKNFIEELEEQINLMNIEKDIKEICVFIINNLNKKGYLEISKIEVKNHLNITQQQLDKAFAKIYELDPCGVGAESFRECLKLQLKKKKILDEIFEKIIDRYLEQIAEKKYEIILNKLEISEKQLNYYIDEIKKLNPIPSRGFNTEKIKMIQVEAFIENKNGEITYELNENIIPKISLRDDIVYNKNTLLKAKILIEALEKRYTTLSKIIEKLIFYQKEFFLYGEEYLKTLKLKEIAKALNLDSSTVSRAIKNKYIKTPYGIMSFKSLICFNLSVVNTKKYIEEYIRAENKEKPLSDKKISELLLEEGVEVARRTVAKYRNELGYSNAKGRKI